MPTRVSLTRYNADYERAIQDTTFQWSTHPELNPQRESSSILSIDENVPYIMDVHLSTSERLYLDGIEMLPKANEDIIQMDDQGRFYINRDAQLHLYNNRDKNKLLPGFYRLELWHPGMTRYAYLHVRSKFLNADEYKRLITDIETTLEGLTKTFRQGYHGRKDAQATPKDDLRSLSILENYYPRFIAAIFYLRGHLRSEVTSTHRWGYNISSGLDQHSINKMASNPQQSKIYSKHHTLDYNVPDNISLKSDLLRLRKIVYRLSKKYKKADFPILAKYLGGLNYLLLDSRLREVDIRYGYHSFLSSRLMAPSYTLMAHLVHELEDVTIRQPAPQREYSFNLKTTEYLYEIWGYFQTIQALSDLGFQPNQDTWFQDGSDVMSSVEKGLAPGTRFQMRNESGTALGYNGVMNVAIIYNEVIPQQESQADPVWTTSPHNIPDIRLDFSDGDDTYIGSIVLDTKYRRVADFMQNHGNGSLRQLSDYKQYVLGPHIFESTAYDPKTVNIYKMNSFPVVANVGAIFPGVITTDNDKHDYGVDPNHLHLKDQVGVYPLMLYPGKTNRPLTHFLTNSISVIVRNVKMNSNISR